MRNISLAPPGTQLLQPILPSSFESPGSLANIAMRPASMLGNNARSSPAANNPPSTPISKAATMPVYSSRTILPLHHQPPGQATPRAGVVQPPPQGTNNAHRPSQQGQGSSSSEVNTTLSPSQESTQAGIPTDEGERVVAGLPQTTTLTGGGETIVTDSKHVGICGLASGVARWILIIVLITHLRGWGELVAKFLATLQGAN